MGRHRWRKRDARDRRVHPDQASGRPNSTLGARITQWVLEDAESKAGPARGSLVCLEGSLLVPGQRGSKRITSRILPHPQPLPEQIRPSLSWTLFWCPCSHCHYSGPVCSHHFCKQQACPVSGCSLPQGVGPSLGFIRSIGEPWCGGVSWGSPVGSPWKIVACPHHPNGSQGCASSEVLQGEQGWWVERGPSMWSSEWSDMLLSIRAVVVGIWVLRVKPVPLCRQSRYKMLGEDRPREAGRREALALRSPFSAYSILLSIVVAFGLLNACAGGGS